MSIKLLTGKLTSSNNHPKYACQSLPVYYSETVMSPSRSRTAFYSFNSAILTISEKRRENDETGDYLVARLKEQGHRIVARDSSDGNIYRLRATISQWIANNGIQLIITNGGTGIAPNKTTHKAISPLLDSQFKGFGELFRQLSYQDIGSSSLQSDAFGGLANNTVVLCLPGSPGACQLAWEKIVKEQLNSQHQPCNFASFFSH